MKPEIAPYVKPEIGQAVWIARGNYCQATVVMHSDDGIAVNMNGEIQTLQADSYGRKFFLNERDLLYKLIESGNVIRDYHEDRLDRVVVKIANLKDRLAEIEGKP